MRINRQSFIEAVSTALRAERDGEQYMEPGIAAHRYGDWCVFRYESRLIPSDRIHFVPWDAASFGIHDRVADMSDDEIGETAAGVFEIFEDDIIEDILDNITDAEY